MDQRVSLITLGVDSIERTSAFYQALGWQHAGESMDEITFFQLSGMVLALYPRALMAEDLGRALGDGAGSMALAQNLGTREGVDLVGQVDVQKKFLRRIPLDPMTGEAEWGMRSYQDDWDASSWGGENGYDVYSLSEAIGLNGIPYREW